MDTAWTTIANRLVGRFVVVTEFLLVMLIEVLVEEKRELHVVVPFMKHEDNKFSDAAIGSLLTLASKERARFDEHHIKTPPHANPHSLHQYAHHLAEIVGHEPRARKMMECIVGRSTGTRRQRFEADDLVVIDKDDPKKIAFGRVKQFYTGRTVLHGRTAPVQQ